jgi:hypothetical protein
MLVMTALGVVAAATFLVPVGGSRLVRSVCQPSVESLSASASSDTTVDISASFSSGSDSGGTWQVDISSPQTTIFGGEFSGPSGSFTQSVAHLVPNTHYRGTLTIRSDCGSVDALIDFRTPATPRCTGPPAIDVFQVGTVGTDSAVVAYSISSGGAATAQFTRAPGGAAVTVSIAPPGGAGQVPLPGLTPNTTYTVVVTATNGCGQSTRQASFTTVRTTDCSQPPRVDDLRVEAITERSARIRYSVASDGVVTAKLIVRPGATEIDRTIPAPGDTGGSSRLGGLKSATRYLVSLTATNACGEASSSKTFVSLGRVAVVVVGSGRVTSVPKGISCSKRCGGAFAAGSRVLLAERPAPGWHFVSWAGAAACKGSARVCRVTARNVRVTARFTRSS